MPRRHRHAIAGVAALALIGLTGCHAEGDGTVEVKYTCMEGDLTAIFPPSKDKVTITFDETSHELPLDSTENGAKYGSDGLVFWTNSPGTAFVAEGDTLKMSNCQADRSEIEVH